PTTTVCARKSPCPDYHVCIDECYGSYKCVPPQPLHAFVQTATSSSVLPPGHSIAANAFDGQETGSFETDNRNRVSSPHWIRATFQQRLFIDEYITVVTRTDLLGTQYEVRSDLTDYSTILHINGQSVQTMFGNTGRILGGRVTLICQKYADELFGYQPVAQGPIGILSMTEIWIYGRPE
uniref:Uncharacterized protein n=1 Tax=Clytia hemisphaerica TaxID=252671 RepID=A0A7M5UZC0_9CNID